MSGEVQALVNYYARAGYPRHIQTVCQEVLKKRPNDPVLQFWRAYGLILEGSYSEVKFGSKIVLVKPKYGEATILFPQHGLVHFAHTSRGFCD